MILGINASRARSGGARAHLIGILSNIDLHQHGISEIHVWSFSSLLDALPSEPWLFKHCPIELKCSIFRQILWERFSLPKALKKNKCSILLNVDAGTVSRFSPAVTMSRDMLSYEPGEIDRYNYFSKKRIRLVLLRYMQNHSLRFSNAVIFLTRYAAGVIQKSCGSLSNISYIPHGVGKEFTKVQKINSWTYGDKPTIRCLYISPIWAFKHQWVVVDAIHALREKGYDINITFVGGGEPKSLDMLNKKVLSLDPDKRFVIQTGHVLHNELSLHLAQADLFIFASSCENMPNTLVESMAAGLPIVCSNRGPMPEVLEDGGIYFDPENPVEIAEAIEEIITNKDKRKWLAKRAKELSRQYSWERCSQETFSVITQTAKESK